MFQIYWVELPQFQWDIQFAARLMNLPGGTVAVKREVVEQLPIIVPPLAEQQRIVAFDTAAKAEQAILTRLIENRMVEMAAIAKRLLAHEQRAS